jgi:RecA/RadA recombinase
MAMARAMRNCIMQPKKTRRVWIAVEPFYPKWAKKFGVAVERLQVINPSHAEQVIEMCGMLMEADNCGLVVLDNLASMVISGQVGRRYAGLFLGHPQIRFGSDWERAQ